MSKAQRLSKLDELLNKASLYSEFLGEQTAEAGELADGETSTVACMLSTARGRSACCSELTTLAVESKKSGLLLAVSPVRPVDSSTVGHCPMLLPAFQLSQRLQPACALQVVATR